MYLCRQAWFLSESWREKQVWSRLLCAYVDKQGFSQGVGERCLEQVSMCLCRQVWFLSWSWGAKQVLSRLQCAYVDKHSFSQEVGERAVAESEHKLCNLQH